MHSWKGVTPRPTSYRTSFALKLGVHALLAAGLLGTTAQYAMADPDDNTAAPATGPSQPQMLPEVSVTDQRTQGFAPKSVQTGPYNGLDALSVPATVNVVTRAVMDAQGDTGLYDALRNVAGVTRQQLSGLAYDNLSIRGIPLDNRASYYFDGVLPVDNNIWMPLEDKERIEVLKGASALYYGFAAPAGIVNMVPKEAGPDPVSSVTLLGDSHGSYGAHIDLSRRFGTDDQFGVRLNAMDEHVDTSIDGDTGYRRFISAAFDWRVTHSLTLQYDVEHIDTSIVEQAGVVPLAANKQGVIVLPGIPNPTQLLSGAGFPTRSSADVNLVRANYAVSDNWNVNFDVGQSVTRRDRWNWVFQKYNVATGAGTVQATEQNGQEYMDQTVRLETNSVFKTGSISHDITIGVAQDWLYQPDFTSVAFTAPQNLYDPVTITALTPSGTTTSFFAQHIRNSGAYVFDRIDLTPQLQFVPGLRRSEYTTSQAGTPNSDVSKTTPSASLSYRVLPNVSVYTSYVEALESEGSAPATAVNANQILPAGVSRQEEIGVRTQLANNTLLSLSLFNVVQPSADTNADNVYVLNGNARYRGIEVSLQGDVTRDLSITASADYLDATQIDSPDPALVGKTPENAAHVTANLFADYRVPGVAGLSISGGMYYIGPRAVNDLDQASIGGYTLFTAGLRYGTRLFGKQTTFQANLENATNKRYWSAVGSNQIGVGLSRSLELSSTIAF